jgi:hypothetical protein
VLHWNFKITCLLFFCKLLVKFLNFDTKVVLSIINLTPSRGRKWHIGNSYTPSVIRTLGKPQSPSIFQSSQLMTPCSFFDPFSTLVGVEVEKGNLLDRLPRLNQLLKPNLLNKLPERRLIGSGTLSTTDIEVWKTTNGSGSNHLQMYVHILSTEPKHSNIGMYFWHQEVEALCAIVPIFMS